MDRLSNLPENVQEMILTLLPIKEAARTSILSKDWRYKWTSIPEIVIDDNYFNDDGFEQAVDNILAVHDGPIYKFYLDSDYDHEEEIDRWIDGLSRQGLKELTIRAGLLIEASSNIFSCKHLRYLSLSGGDIQVPFDFQGFEFLNTLELLCVTFSEEDIEKLVSSCPLLKKLVLNVFCYVALNIRALNLEYLEIEGDFLDLVLCAPKLRTLYLKKHLIDGQVDNFSEIDLPRLFRGQPNIERLEMDCVTIMQCSGPLPNAALVSLKCLEEVDLTLGFEAGADDAIVFSLFETVPDQEDTSITVSGKITRWETTVSRDVLLKHLQEEKVEDFERVCSFISFIKFILRSAPKLQSLKFCTCGTWLYQSDVANCKRSFSEPWKLRVFLVK